MAGGNRLLATTPLPRQSKAVTTSLRFAKIIARLLSHTLQMLSWTILPPELWLAIFDHVVEARVNPANSCTYLNYPEISLHLRLPNTYGPIDDSYCQLRLVCRAFKTLLGPSPYFSMRNESTGIPSMARAVNIILFQDSPDALRRILAEPEKARRFTTLHIGYDGSKHLRGRILFAFLFENSHLLSGLRVLGLSICDPEAKTLGFNFWARLSAAFPHLICLTLRLMMEWNSPSVVLATGDVDQSIPFNQLEIMDLGSIFLYSGLQLPSLRHITFDRCSQKEIETLAHSPLLESILLRGIEPHVHLDLSVLPSLRLLGIPNDGKDIVQLLLHDHPLTHLCAFLTSPMADFLNLIAWVKGIPSYFPGIARLTVDLTLLKHTDRLLIEAFFTHVDLQSKGLLVTPFRAGTPHIVVEPILGPFQPDTATMDDSHLIPTTRAERLKAMWNRVSRYTSVPRNL